MSKKDEGGVGRLYRRAGSPFWWIQLGHGGTDLRMSTKKVDKKQARDLLKAKITEAGTGTLNPSAERLSFEKIWAALERKDALAKQRPGTVRGRKVAKARLTARFALAPVRRLPEMAESYIIESRKAGLSDSSIGGDLKTLRKALRCAGAEQVAAQMGAVIQNLEKSPARQGFVTEERLDALCRHLPEAIQDVARFAFWSGWRREEILGLTWAETDTDEGAIRLAGERTKTGAPRYLPFGQHAQLAELMARRREQADAIERDRRARGDITPVEYVLTWEDGRQIRAFQRRWDAARKAIGRPELLLHDMRRSFARRMTLLGVSQKATMMLGGWESPSVFSRYNIVSPADLEDAMRKGGAADSATSRPRRAAAATSREDE